MTVGFAGKRKEPDRHRWFDDWRGVKSDGLRSLMQEVLGEIDASERRAGTRTRRRRPTDQANHERAVEIIIANMAHAVLMPPATGRLAILTGNGWEGATRYDNRALGKPLRTILDRLEDMAVLDRRWSTQRGEASSIAPTEAFARNVMAAGITLADFSRLKGEETIILSMKLRLPGADYVSREQIDYADTPETVAMRQTVDSLNAFIAAGNIAFLDDGLGQIDSYDRTQRRRFTTKEEASKTPAFDRTGRLFGGFWQQLRSDRRRHIRIEGEPVALLDYVSLFPRLAYASVDAGPPPGDLYDIAGLEQHRKAVKKALNCLMMDDYSRTRSKWPKELVDETEEDASDRLPRGWTVKKTKTAILKKHPALTPCLGRGLGLHFMYTESEILIRVLEELKARSIIGLGLHDGLMVPMSKGEEARSIMVEVAASITSATIPVTLVSLG